MHTHTAARKRERRSSCRGINVAIDRYDDDVDKRGDRSGDATISVVMPKPLPPSRCLYLSLGLTSNELFIQRLFFRALSLCD